MHCRRALARTLAIPLILAACRPAPPPPAAAPTPAAPAGPSGQRSVPAEMRAVPEQPAAAYRHLLGTGETPQEGGRILRHLESDLKTLNPVLQTETYENYTNRYLFEPLVDWNADLEIVPVLAENWEVAPDHLSARLALRKGVRFHDGQPFTARDVCFTFDSILDPKIPAINTRSSLNQLAQCRVLGEHEIELAWKAPYAPWLAAIAGIMILPEHVYKVADPAEFARQPANRSPVGTGPFRFVSWESQARVVLKRFDDYWGGRPRVEETVLKVIDNRETALKASLTGDLDEQYVPTAKWFGEVAGPDYDDFHRVLYYTFSFNTYSLNNRSPLFSDRRVRQAMAMAHNAAGVVRDLYDGLARPISGPFHVLSPWYDHGVEPRPFDLARAAGLLEEAGWKDGNGDGTVDKDGKEFAFELLYPSGNTISEQTGVVYQQDLARIGIKMTLRALEGATFFDRVNRGEFEAATFAWQSDPDPDSMMSLFDSRQHPPMGINTQFYANPEVDALIDAQRREFDPGKRAEILHRIHRILHEDVPILFALSTPMKRIFRKTLRGVAINVQEPFLVQPGAEDWWLVPRAGRAAAR